VVTEFFTTALATSGRSISTRHYNPLHHTSCEKCAASGNRPGVHSVGNREDDFPELSTRSARLPGHSEIRQRERALQFVQRIRVY
jgi:hypothetical protein